MAWPTATQIRRACKIAISEAERSASKLEGGPNSASSHPLVGAVALSKDGVVLGLAGRNGQKKLHAEVNLLEDLVASDVLDQVHTVVTTLEPCCYRDDKDKLSCAKHLARLGPEQVVVGTLDPAHGVRGRGFQILGMADVYVTMFPWNLSRDLRRINSKYWERHARLYRASDRIRPRSGIVPDDREFDLLLAPRKIAKTVKGDPFNHLMYAYLQGWLSSHFEKTVAEPLTFEAYVAVREKYLSLTGRARRGLERFFRGSTYEVLATYLAINRRRQSRFDVYGEVGRWWYSRCGFRLVHQAGSRVPANSVSFDIG